MISSSLTKSHLQRCFPRPPNKVTMTGPKWTYLSGVHDSTHHNFFCCFPSPQERINKTGWEARAFLQKSCFNRLREQTYGCRGKGHLGMGMYTLLYLKQITNKGHSIAHGTLLNVMWWPGWEGSLAVGGMDTDTYICMAEPLCCSSETITTLLLGYTPTQN